MMTTTHAAVGVLLAAPLALVAPEFAAVAGLTAVAGSVFPDLDVAFEHRKTLHDPVLYWVAALPAAGVALLAPGPATVGAAVFLGAAAVHCVTDVAGGGLGLRPWEVDDDRGVYDHLRGRWIAPRRWIRYDGAPEDLVAVVALSVPGLVVFDGPVRALLVAGVAVSVVYTAVRKRLPEWAPGLLE